MKFYLQNRADQVLSFEARDHQIERVNSQKFSPDFHIYVLVSRSQRIFDEFCLLKQKQMLSVFCLKVMYFQFSTMNQIFGSPVNLDYNSVWRKLKEDVLSGSVENGISPIQTMSYV